MTARHDVPAAMRRWAEAQQQLVESWSSLLRDGARAMHAFVPTSTDASGDGADRPGHGAPSDTGLGDRLSESRGLLDAIAELSLGSWRAALDAQRGSGDWLDAMTAFGQRWLSSSFGAGLDALQAEIDSDELWRRYVGQLHGLNMTALGAVDNSRQMLGHVADELGPGWLGSLHDGWDLLPRMAGGLAEAPQLGTVNPLLYRKMLEGFDAWCSCQALSHEFHTLRAKAWLEMIRRAGEALAERAKRGEPVQSLREWLLLWIGAGDDVLMRMYRSDEYLRVQRELVLAVSTYRKRAQQINDLVLRAHNLPTREELDDAYRVIQALRRDVRALKRTVRALDTNATPPAGKSRRRRAARTEAASRTPRGAPSRGRR